MAVRQTDQIFVVAIVALERQDAVEAGTVRRDAKLISVDDESANDKSISTETTRLVAPAVTQPQTIHVILQIEDEGTPSLFAYRRTVITVQTNPTDKQDASR